MIDPVKRFRLKCFVIKDAQHNSYLVPGARAYRRISGVDIPVLTLGKQFRDTLRIFQGRHGLPADGTFNQKTQDFVEPPPPPELWRDNVVKFWNYIIDKAVSIHYSQQRPIDGINDLYRTPSYNDCSGECVKGAKAGGAKDPTGYRFLGYGNTESMQANCKEILSSQALRGDYVLYVGHHVCTLLEDWRGPNTMMGSHGHESAPERISFATETSYHSGQRVMFLQAVKG